MFNIIYSCAGAGVSIRIVPTHCFPQDDCFIWTPLYKVAMYLTHVWQVPGLSSGW